MTQKRRRKTQVVQYTIRTDSTSVGKLILWSMFAAMGIGLAAALILIPAANAIPGTQYGSMQNSTGNYSVRYIPTLSQSEAGISNFVIAALAFLGVGLAAYIYRPSVNWKVSRAKTMAAVVDTAMEE